MRRASRVLLVVTAFVIAPAGVAHAAVPVEKRCATTRRAYTDGYPEVYVAKGKTSCATAKSVMRRYWQSDPSGTKARRITLHAVRWSCQRVTPTSAPGAWQCRSPRGRSVVTAGE